MLATHFTRAWGFRYPIISAPMANIAHGRLARAVTEAGGLGMIGIGNKDTPAIGEREAAIAATVRRFDLEFASSRGR